jgi:hypothetical protein
MREESASYRLKLLDQYIHALIKRFLSATSREWGSR